MKSIVILLAAFILPALSFSQSVSETLLEEKIGELDCVFKKSTTEGRTFHMVFLFYQNAEYKHITDLASVALTDSMQLNELVADIDSVLSIMEDPSSKGKMYTWERKRYTLYKFSSSNDSIALYNKKEQYTYLSKKNLIKLRDWLNTVEFPA